MRKSTQKWQRRAVRYLTTMQRDLSEAVEYRLRFAKMGKLDRAIAKVRTS